MPELEVIRPNENVFDSNSKIARQLRRKFSENNVLALNIVSSPGSGKTTILERTLRELSPELNMAVIEGDQHTNRDAERIRNTGVPVKQINTLSGCHLDALMIANVLDNFDLGALDVLFIENVGNLVCPSAFDLGEDFRVLTLSVTEGEDKPLKYPAMFLSSHIVLLNKVDLVSVLEFNIQECLGYIDRITPCASIFEVSARYGQGMQNWYQWLKIAVQKKSQKENYSHNENN